MTQRQDLRYSGLCLRRLQNGVGHRVAVGFTDGHNAAVAEERAHLSGALPARAAPFARLKARRGDELTHT